MAAESESNISRSWRSENNNGNMKEKWRK